ncbi:MAG TPA: hypothetical protein VKU19_29235 [Bryobacteraceae bacterium]|nr:hypothetical protein [Bryobacteraceae bacterium]
MRFLLFLVCASLALAQGGTEPKPKAEDYDVHGQYRDIEIGAEFMIHSVSGQGQTYLTKDFLVVEVALYPPKEKGLTINNGEFALRINGKKQLLGAAAPSMVVADLERPEWQSGPRLEAGGGLGNTGVILGRPTPTQIPQGQPPPQSRVPRTPAPDNGGIEPERRVTPEELVVQAALQEGQHRGAFSGFLYFPFTGKTTSIKTLELLYEDAVLKLR